MITTLHEPKPLTQIISGERKNGPIYLNRRAMTVRLLLDPNLREKFFEYFRQGTFQLPCTMSPDCLDEIADEFRRRLTVELEYKLIGELGTKLNNSLKKVRAAEKSRTLATKDSEQSTDPIRSGSSPRQNIAQTSRRQSDGHLIR